MATGVRLMVVRAHPDDESSATGGVLARYAAQGVSTGVVICTGGEEGEILDPDLDPIEAKPRLGEIRKRELETATNLLGVSELRMLGYRDSGMEGWETNKHPDAFCNANRDEAVGRLVRVIRELQPQVVITDNENGGYGHPDHVMCNRVTVPAFHAAGDPEQYPEAGPVWKPARLYAVVSVRDRWGKIAKLMREAGFDDSFYTSRRRPSRRWGVAKKDATVALDVSDYVEIQRSALDAHRSQIARDSWWLIMPPEIRRVAFGTAFFLRLHPQPAPGEKDADLFAGLD